MLQSRSRTVSTSLSQALVMGGLCVGAAFSSQVIAYEKKNILLIIADDYGIDSSSLYNKTPQKVALPYTPVIEGLADKGRTFDTVWSMPSCTPTRAQIMTGRYALRTGVVFPIGNFTANRPEYQLNLAQELTLPQLMSMDPSYEQYNKALIGKWHLTNNRTVGGINDAWDDPLRAGFDYWSGTIQGALGSYYGGQKIVGSGKPNELPGMTTSQAQVIPTGKYVLSDKIDETVNFIANSEGDDKPWFVWLALNAPHWTGGPAGLQFPLPPKHLFTSDANENSSQQVKYRAIVEAMDKEIGRLLQHVDLENTHLVFIGDNGTSNLVAYPPVDPRRAKNTAYEGGIRVPLVVSGPAVPEQRKGERSGALINTTDLYQFIAELADVPDYLYLDRGEVSDSMGFKTVLSKDKNFTLRPKLFADWTGLPDPIQVAGDANGDGVVEPGETVIRNLLTSPFFELAPVGGRLKPAYAIRDKRYKYIRYTNLDEVNADIINDNAATNGNEALVVDEELYDLQNDPWEKNNLLNGQLTSKQDDVLYLLRYSMDQIINTQDPVWYYY